ncbi:MAG: asparagine synthase-related protein [Microthrixaceae bacterium]
MRHFIIFSARSSRRPTTAGICATADGQQADEVVRWIQGVLGQRLHRTGPLCRLVQAAKLVRSVLQRPDTRARLDRAAIAQTLAGVLPAGLQARFMRGAGAGEFPEWMNQNWFESHGVHGSAPETSKTLDESLIRAFVSTNLPSLLRYDDLNSMRSSIESRLQFLDPGPDHRSLGHPRDAIMGTGGVSKLALRQSLRGLVPISIPDRTDKTGFDAPEKVWLEPLAPGGWRACCVRDAMDRIPGSIAEHAWTTGTR